MKDSKCSSSFAKLLLLIVAILWGSSLTVVKNASSVFPPFMILGMRFSIAAVILAAVFHRRLSLITASDVRNGLMIGVFLFLAYASQTVGVMYSVPGRSGFLSASYCVIVPFLEWIVKKKKPQSKNLLSAFICVMGIFLIALSTNAGNETQLSNVPEWLGDGLALLSGVMFASHIVAVGILGNGRDPIAMTVLQFVTAAVTSWGLSFLVESPLKVNIESEPFMEVMYLAVMCTAVALLFQNIGQKYTDASSASIILGMESVFGIIIPVMLGVERITNSEIVGFVLILSAIWISEGKFKVHKRTDNSCDHSMTQKDS